VLDCDLALRCDAVVVDLRSGEERSRVAISQQVFDGELSPDGAWLVLRSRGLGSLGVLDLTTGEVRELDDPGPCCGEVRWAPDSSRVLVLTGERITSVDPTTGAADTAVLEPLQLESSMLLPKTGGSRG
jgi:hypothetical protein